MTCTYKVQKKSHFLMKPSTGYYELLHYDLHIYGQENKSHFLMKPFNRVYW